MYCMVQWPPLRGSKGTTCVWVMRPLEAGGPSLVRALGYLAVTYEGASSGVNGEISRAGFLSRGAMGGAALLAAGTAVAALAPVAAADLLSDNDLAIARVLVAAELLGIDFYQQSIDAKKLDKEDTKRFAQILSNEKEHYQSVAQILSGAGQVPATALDIDMSYPKGTFDSAESINKQAQAIESIMLGCYLGAVAGYQSIAIAAGLATIGASEAQHVAFFQTKLTGKPFALAFPGPPLGFDAATAALDVYQT